MTARLTVLVRMVGMLAVRLRTALAQRRSGPCGRTFRWVTAVRVRTVARWSIRGLTLPCIHFPAMLFAWRIIHSSFFGRASAP